MTASDTLSPAEYAQFLKGHIKQQFSGPVLLFGASDDAHVLCVSYLRFNDYSCGLLIRPSNGAQDVSQLAEMDEKQYFQYIKDNPDPEQVVLAFVNPLDALRFLSGHVLQAFTLLGEDQGIVPEEVDEWVTELGIKERAELLKLRRAVRAHLRKPDQRTLDRLADLIGPAAQP